MHTRRIEDMHHRKLLHTDSLNTHDRIIGGQIDIDQRPFTPGDRAAYFAPRLKTNIHAAPLSGELHHRGDLCANAEL